ATRTSSNRKPRSRRPSLQPPPTRDDHDPQDHSCRGGRARRAAAVELHLGQDSGKTDRDQPQRDHQAGGAGAAAARRRAADHPEPPGLPAAAAATAAPEMRTLAFLAAAALAGPALAQTPAVDAARSA